MRTQYYFRLKHRNGILEGLVFFLLLFVPTFSYSHGMELFAMRIPFESGSGLVKIRGYLPAAKIDHYVFYANAGQELIITISKGAIIAVWGKDGTVLISDHAEAVYWKGTLPRRQDYYIAVASGPQKDISYELSIKLFLFPKDLDNDSKTHEFFSDPFSYCNRVNTIDIPDKRYIGPRVPDLIINSLKRDLKMAQDVSEDWIKKGTYWRCMNANVWVCFTGANIACMTKANNSKTPSLEMKAFCERHPDVGPIPSYITGHNTIYEWHCVDGVPMVTIQIYHPDERGFISEFWHKVELRGADAK